MQSAYPLIWLDKPLGLVDLLNETGAGPNHNPIDRRASIVSLKGAQ